MNRNDDINLKNGLFSISPTREISGTISLNGSNSVLHLWSDKEFNVDVSEGKTITGILDNQKKVSLIGCVKINERNSVSDGGFSQHKKFFPLYVIIGNSYFSHSDDVVSNVSLILDDAATLFYDGETFGTILVDSDELKDLTKLDVFHNIPFVKGWPIIAYFTGKFKIFSIDTVIGKVSARHSPKLSVPDKTTGAQIDNKIYVDINFSKPVSVTEMEHRIRKVLRFFEIIVGRPQNLLEVNILQFQNDAETASSSVYINSYPKRNVKTENKELNFRDVLIGGGTASAQFERILSAWLKRDETWINARLRFSEGWSQQRSYDGDRIIRAANMFDLLPEEALPEDSPLTGDLASAVSEANDIFGKLPQSSKKALILGTLGRIKQPSLKQKIRYRSSIITKLVGNQIPEIHVITDAAVDLRNIYVHGGSAVRNINKLILFQKFLTDSLEFVFCASDLVDLGWDIEAWCQRSMLDNHPFSRYIHAYKMNLSEFKKFQN